MFIYSDDKNKNRAQVVCHIKWNLGAMASIGTEVGRGGTGAEEIHGIAEWQGSTNQGSERS